MVEYSRQHQWVRPRAVQPTVASSCRNNAAFREPWEELGLVDSAGIAKMSGIHPGHFRDARSVIPDFSSKQIAVQRRAVPMRVQLEADSFLSQQRYFVGIQIVQDAFCNQIPVGYF